LGVHDAVVVGEGEGTGAALGMLVEKRLGGLRREEDKEIGIWLRRCFLGLGRTVDFVLVLFVFFRENFWSCLFM
jgi:hypothetical protein